MKKKTSKEKTIEDKEPKDKEADIEKSDKTEELSNPSEEELQKGKGINADLPENVYTYDEIVNQAPVGVVHPNEKSTYYDKSPSESQKIYQNLIAQELKKIDPQPISDDATDEQIEKFFQQILYILGHDYQPVESINRFSYLVFKDDQQEPFTHKVIDENINVNLEIVLDASGSMAKTIEGQTMMDIAKESIDSVVSTMPANSKVGIRVFGHLGDNTQSGQVEFCGANQLIYPIEDLNPEGIKAALAPIKPTGWTSIAKSIETEQQI